jgi:hypothetical protein
MSRIHLRSNTMVLWLSLSAAVGAASIGVGCSSSDSGGTEAGGASAGKGGKSGATAGAPASDAGDTSVGGTDTGMGGDDMPGSGGKVAGGGAPPVGDGGEPGEAGAAGALTGGDDESAAAIKRTKTLIGTLLPAEQCPACHQPNYAGFQYWPNITPDPVNGIGGDEWTDEKIIGAIHEGRKADGKVLCDQMTRYPFTNAQLKDFVVFLRSLTPSSNKITSICPSPAGT